MSQLTEGRNTLEQQETATDGMAGLQSGNKIWETDWEQA